MKERILISRISRDMKNTIKDCLLSLFYRKKDLIQFLGDCGSTGNDMSSIYEEMTKSDIVDTYFLNITKRSDGGMMQYHSLIRQLVSWDDFDSYWFRQGGLDAVDAKGRIGALKKLLGEKTEREEELSKRKEREADAEKVKIKNRTIEDLRKEFYEMCTMTDSSQKRGFQLEKFLQELFGVFEIESQKAFKLEAEQIDGSFKFDGENYIFEAKWQDMPSACNSLYAFAYKIQSNSLYPRGVFFSMNGYSEEALNRITHNKNPELILFDAVDMVAVVEERIALPKIIGEKIKYAQTKGRIYINADEILK